MNKMKKILNTTNTIIKLSSIFSPIILRGDASTAYRDPAVIYHDGCFHMYFTLSKIEPDGKVYLRLAHSESRNLLEWSVPDFMTTKDQTKNFSSPGNIIRFENEWVICFQTYPRPNGEMYGNDDSRLWIMRSKDLKTWREPELLRAKGPDIPIEKMGRMIDPYILEDKDERGKWWCFYKQNGVSLSWSRDLKTWNYTGTEKGGENVCVLTDDDEYVLFHSPGNGIGVKRSKDLRTWRDLGVLTLDQKNWPWAQGRLTAGFVLDLRHEPEIGKYIMFFHGSDYPEKDVRGGFDNYASIALAWSSDLKEWFWPGKPDK